MPIQIDSRAIVSPKATIGDGVQVGPYAVIEDDVAIGEGTTIGAHTVIHSGSRIGRECRIHPMAAIGGLPQDLKFRGEPTTLEIGDNTVIGGDAIIIGHVVERGRLKLHKVKIGKNVTLGSHCTVMPGCEIGDNAIIGAGAVLLKNTKVEPRAIWYGIPAEPIRPHRKEEQ